LIFNQYSNIVQRSLRVQRSTSTLGRSAYCKFFKFSSNVNNVILFEYNFNLMNQFAVIQIYSMWVLNTLLIVLSLVQLNSTNIIIALIWWGYFEIMFDVGMTHKRIESLTIAQWTLGQGLEQTSSLFMLIKMVVGLKYPTGCRSQ
jgi:hypothetical protein